MKKIFAALAKIIYYVFYPLFGLYLHNSRRNRILVLSGKHILLVRSFAGNQKWSLPGGGIKKSENPIKAATRELKEETGISVDDSELECIGEDRLPKNRIWPHYAVIFYRVNLSNKVELKIHHKHEVIEAKWFSVNDLPKITAESVQTALKMHVK